LLEPHVVDDQEIGAQIPPQRVVLAGEGFVLQKFPDDIEELAVQDLDPPLDRLVSQSLGQNATSLAPELAGQ